MQKAVITPSSVAVLSAAPARSTAHNAPVETQPVPQQSLWSRIGGFFREVFAFVKPLFAFVAVAATALNAVARFKMVMA